MKSVSINFDSHPLLYLIVSKDSTLSCLSANNTFLDALQISSIEGKTLHDFWPKLSIEDLANKSSLQYETSQNNQIFFRPYLNEGQYEGKDVYILTLSDITDLVASSEDLQEAVIEASQTAEMKSNFLATMSHEIRTPMQAIFGILELIGEEKPKQSIVDMIATAKESASGLLEILDDILDVAKIDADKMELDDFEVPIRLLARGTIEALAARKTSNRVALLDDIDPSVPFVIKGDPKRLRQIIMNFISNAVKFTKEGHIKTRIHTNTKYIKAPEGGVAIRFEVEDTGMGMSEEVRSRLFQPFQQADNSTARKFGGTGLGLSICKKLVELMGGKIGVDSVVGKGSTFWFEIPTVTVSTDQTTIDLPDLDGLAVLSVEDHPQGGKEIMNSLRSMGAEVVLVATYAEGLDMAKRRPFDVAVVDQGLPDGLGIDLLKEFSEIRPFMGQILYTVRDDYGLQHSCRALGATYLAKPASRAGLGEAVKDASDKSSQFQLDGPRRLLIAEDTDSVRQILKKQLQVLGADADFVEDGRQALEAMRSGKYGILITDLHMPEVDGYQVVNEIRSQEELSEDHKHIPVIVLTADVQMAQRQAYLAQGFDECLLKPVSLGQFRRLLIRWGFLNEQEAIEAHGEHDEKKKSDTNLDALPIIDLDAMKAQMGEVSEDTLSMIGMFLDMTEPLIQKIHAAFESSDHEALSEAAHSLKGGARSACCMALGLVAEKLQDDAHEKKDCTNLIKQMDVEFARIKPELERLKS